MRILISGFGVFGQEVENPTEMLINEIIAGHLRIPDSFEVRALVLPVSFQNAPKILMDEVRAFDPDIVLAFGLAGGREAIEFERVAINIMNAGIPDNDGYQPVEMAIDPLGPAAYFSTIPIQTLSACLCREGIPSRISNTAGLYVCNATLYLLLQGLSAGKRAGFVHVPRLQDLAFTNLARALEVILVALAET